MSCKVQHDHYFCLLTSNHHFAEYTLSFWLLAKKKCRLADKERSQDGPSRSLLLACNFYSSLSRIHVVFLAACKKNEKRDPRMALTFEFFQFPIWVFQFSMLAKNCKERSWDGLDFSSRERRSSWERTIPQEFWRGDWGGGCADAAGNSGYQLYKSLNNNMIYHWKSSLRQNWE